MTDFINKCDEYHIRRGHKFNTVLCRSCLIRCRRWRLAPKQQRRQWSGWGDLEFMLAWSHERWLWKTLSSSRLHWQVMINIQYRRLDWCKQKIKWLNIFKVKNASYVVICLKVSDRSSISIPSFQGSQAVGYPGVETLSIYQYYKCPCKVVVN